jgi:hypothetical protein
MVSIDKAAPWPSRLRRCFIGVPPAAISRFCRSFDSRPVERAHAAVELVELAGFLRDKGLSCGGCRHPLSDGETGAPQGLPLSDCRDRPQAMRVKDTSWRM